MFTILRNIWQNELRHRAQDLQNASASALLVAPMPETPDGALTRKLVRSEVRHALEALPEPYREVVVLREIESMSYAEIAHIIQCPAGTVMSRLARGRALLRELLVNVNSMARTASR